MAPHPEADALLSRSNRLGSDPRNTNYAGGNTSAKGTDTDPVTGGDVELMWVKGSGGDLGTLTEGGLAVLRLDRMRALADVYPGSTARTRWSPRSTTACTARGCGAFHRHRHARAGGRCSCRSPAPGLGDRARLCGRRGEADRRVFRGQRGVGAVAAARVSVGARHRRRQGRQSAGHRLCARGHGITAWGDSSEECERNSLHIIRTAEAFLVERGKPEPFGPVIEGYGALPEAERRERGPRSRRTSALSRPRTGRRWGTSPIPTSSSISLRGPSIPGSPRSVPRAPTTFYGPRSGRSSSICRRPHRSTKPSRG